MKMVTDVAGRSFAAWPEFKKSTANSAGGAAAQANHGEELGQGLKAEINGASGAEANIKYSQANSGSERGGVSSLLEDASNRATTTGKVQSEDLRDSSAEPAFNEKNPAVPPAGGESSETTWSRFNTAANWLRAVEIATSVSLVIVMSVAVARSWGRVRGRDGWRPPRRPCS